MSKNKADKSKGNENAFRNTARKWAAKSPEEIESFCNKYELTKPELVAYLRKHIPEMKKEIEEKAAERAGLKPAELTTAPETIPMNEETKTEEKSTVADAGADVPVATVVSAVAETVNASEAVPQKIADPAIKAGLDEVKGLLSECEEIAARLEEDNPTTATGEEKKAALVPFSLENRKPGDVLWEWKPREKKDEREEKRRNGGNNMNDRNNDATPGLVIVRDERKKERNRRKRFRKLESSAHETRPEEAKEQTPEIISEQTGDHTFYAFENVTRKAPDRSFVKEMQDGNPAIGKRYKIEDENGNIKRFRVLIPGSVLGRECKQFPEKNGKPAYTWRTIFVSGTTLRVNLNLRRNKDGTILEPSPNENGDIIGEAEIGFNVSIKNNNIYAVQYMNVYAPNGTAGDLYKVRADLSRGQQKPGDITIGPSIGTYVKSKQDQKTADAEIILHLDKVPAPQ